ncbi:MAG TPA: Gfo/Idh/MocA family oxidoreductase [Verrucomicrobiae bacterium]|nr:Gfo/Idh/MocA family oxidoreductase [Verrucomicrobiae bacterium]
MSSEDCEYGLSKQVHSAGISAPEYDYLPRLPNTFRPKVGLIGAGGVTEYHLRAYRALGLQVVAICDLDARRAQSRREQFFPNAVTTTDFRDVLRREEIEVVDVALHPEHRGPVVEASISAGKHVLSQKPFVTDLNDGLRLIELADKRRVKLAVNQNGRCAPHFAYALAAARSGALGEIGTVDFNLLFDHSWTIGTPFENIHHLLLYDFGIHWFDLASCFLPDDGPHEVYARVSRLPYQKARPPFAASVIINSTASQVRLSLNGAVSLGQTDRTLIAGSLGTLESTGPSLSEQRVVLATAAGVASPQLRGTWFENGFQGTMCELLCAIEEGREPRNSARGNIRSLELCFAAVRSANTGLPVRSGAVRTLPQ